MTSSKSTKYVGKWCLLNVVVDWFVSDSGHPFLAAGLAGSSSPMGGFNPGSFFMPPLQQQHHHHHHHHNSHHSHISINNNNNHQQQQQMLQDQLRLMNHRSNDQQQLDDRPRPQPPNQGSNPALMASEAAKTLLHTLSLSHVFSPPACIELRESEGGQGGAGAALGVWATEPIAEGAKFGPFLGRWTAEPMNPHYAWEVGQKTGLKS